MIRIQGQGHKYGTDKFNVEFECDSEEELAALEGMSHSTKWVRIIDGKLEVCEAYKPTPVEDPHLEFHFPAANNPVLHHTHPSKDRLTGAIYVQHILGYRTDISYKDQAKLLEKAGFECLRSRRGDDGLTWEIWYLASPFLGEGPIKGMKTTTEIRKWLFNEIRPGEVTLEGEHWGLSVD